MTGRDFTVDAILSLVHVDALQLEVGVSVVRTRRVDAVLIADHLCCRLRLRSQKDQDKPADAASDHS